jgi:hypothetical protein
MKTFEEALKVQTTMSRAEAGEEMPMPVRNALDTAEEVMASERATRYIGGMVMIAIENAPDDLPDELFFDFAMGLAMSAFLAGIRVGIEMEKQELPAGTAKGAS